MTFKRTILLLSLFGLTLTPAFANFSITTDGLYSRRLSGNIGHNNGCGGSLLLELEPSSNFSLGLDLDTLLYWGVVTPGISLVEMVGGVTRFTFNPDDPLPLYLILGGGINPKVAVSGTYLWNGDYHLFGGLGAKFFIDPGTAFDFSAVYDYADSPGNVLQTLQGRIGMSFYLENAHGAGKPAATPIPTPAPTPMPVAAPLETPAPQPTAAPTAVEPPAPTPQTVTLPAAEPTQAPTPVPTAVPTAEPASPSAQEEGLPPGTHAKVVTEKGYSLWEISENILGDPELYPILVDANDRSMLAGKTMLPSGIRLAVPDTITDAQKEKARLNAWKPAYTRYRGRGLTKMGYQRWRSEHGLSSTWKDPDYSGGKP